MAYQFLRGDTEANDAYTGPAGSITVDFEGETIRIHDGSTAGGAYRVAISDLSVNYSSTETTIVSQLGNNAVIDSATPTRSGVLSASDKAKLNGIQPGAQENDVNSVAGKTGTVLLSKSDVGLGQLDNAPKASQDQAEAANSNSYYMSPLRTGQAIEERTGIVDEGGYTRKKPDEVVWFYAYRNSNYSSADGISTIQFNATRAGSRNFSTATHAFTAPADGVYSFNAQVLREGGVNANGINIGISKNNADTGEGIAKGFVEKKGTDNDDSILMCNVSTVFPLAKGDTVRVLALNEIPIAGDSTNIYTFFQGHLL